MSGRVESPLDKLIRLERERRNARAESYRWKAENIVRFFDGLGMTTEEKVDFLAKELGAVHWVAVIRDRNGKGDL